MNIYPAIDIKGGACVRLMQGLQDKKTQYFNDPVEPARRFLEQGATWIHVVDLDGAFTGQPANLNIISAIAELGLKVQTGGGIRSIEDIQRVLAAGASRFVVGTRACESLEFVSEIAESWPEEACVGIDSRDGMAAIHGWVDTTQVTAASLARSVAESGIKRIIYTDISDDGMMTGPNFEGHKSMWKSTGSASVAFIASGGVHDRHDIVHYRNLAERFPQLDGVIVGKALYEGKVDLADLIAIADSLSQP